MNKVLKTSAGITVNRTRLLSNKYLLKELRKRILKEVGKPCKDYYPFCFDCAMRKIENLPLYGAIESMEETKKKKLKEDIHDYNPEFDKAIDSLRKFCEEAMSQDTIYIQMAIENDYKRPKITDEV